jgi:hypothetical protein
MEVLLVLRTYPPTGGIYASCNEHVQRSIGHCVTVSFRSITVILFYKDMTTMHQMHRLFTEEV